MLWSFFGTPILEPQRRKTRTWRYSSVVPRLRWEMFSSDVLRGRVRRSERSLQATNFLICICLASRVTRTHIFAHAQVHSECVENRSLNRSITPCFAQFNALPPPPSIAISLCAYLAERRHIHIDDVFIEALLAGKEAALDGRTVGNSLIRIDASVRLFAVEEFFQQLLYLPFCDVCPCLYTQYVQHVVNNDRGNGNDRKTLV